VRELQAQPTASRPRAPRLALALCSTILVVLLATGSAIAAGLYEPNENIDQTAGPFPGDTTVSGMLETTTDRDWYRIRIIGGQQIAFTASVGSATGNTCFGTAWSLKDYFGQELDGGYFVTTDGKASSHVFRYTTPPADGTYYVVWSPSQGGINCPYSWSVSPAATVTTAEPPAPPELTTTEPNETDMQAFGPLAGDTRYSGAIDTSNDRDLAFFYAKRATQITVELTGLGACNSPSQRDVVVYGPFGSTASTAASNNSRGVKTFTPAPYGGRYGVNVTAPLGCRWQVQLSPTSAVSATPVVPQNGGAATIAAAQPIVMGQLHEGGDSPGEFWRVPGLVAGDQLQLQVDEPQAPGVAGPFVELFDSSTTDASLTTTKPVATAGTRGGQSFATVRALTGGSAVLAILSGHGARNPQFSFTPLIVRHATRTKLSPLARRLVRGRTVHLTASVSSRAGVPAGTCTLARIVGGRRPTLAGARLVHGRCRFSFRTPRRARLRVQASFRPTDPWLASQATSRTVAIRRR
jgi:hypothetical protein